MRKYKIFIAVINILGVIGLVVQIHDMNDRIRALERPFSTPTQDWQEAAKLEKQPNCGGK